jgi:hypothetical protein
MVNRTWQNIRMRAHPGLVSSPFCDTKLVARPNVVRVPGTAGTAVSMRRAILASRIKLRIGAIHLPATHPAAFEVHVESMGRYTEGRARPPEERPLICGHPSPNAVASGPQSLKTGGATFARQSPLKLMVLMNARVRICDLSALVWLG